MYIWIYKEIYSYIYIYIYVYIKTDRHLKPALRHHFAAAGRCLRHSQQHARRRLEKLARGGRLGVRHKLGQYQDGIVLKKQKGI